MEVVVIIAIVLGVLVGIGKSKARSQALAAPPGGQPVITRQYVGGRSQIRLEFEKQSAVYARHGYVVDSTSTVPGHRSVFKGLIWTPKDMLIVTYKRQDKG